MFRKLFLVILLLMAASSQAQERYTDPDGCFSCHALSGLQYIDEQGLLRDASIDESHYYSSLHGSVPCRDCHRQIRYYPHKVENGEVDCAETCHVNEPSIGEAFTHKEVVKEFQQSAHGEGATKGFTGANRLAEEDRSQSPSCRRCHSNSAYIEAHQLDNFMESFQHTNTECGTCHQGEAWRNQLSGHILRRFIGARWKKTESNKICNDCHADIATMQKVQLTAENGKDKQASSYRWQHASASYAKSLHSRLLVTENESGASCLDCHAPGDAPGGNSFRHQIKPAGESASATHQDNLPQTCGQSSCHEFAQHPSNEEFVLADQHSLDRLPHPEYQLASLFDPQRLESNWYRAFLILALLAAVFGLGQLLQFILVWRSENSEPLFGSGHFKKTMLGRTNKNNVKNGRKKVEPKRKKGTGK